MKSNREKTVIKTNIDKNPETLSAIYVLITMTILVASSVLYFVIKRKKYN